MKDYIVEEIDISPTSATIVAARKGRRTRLKEQHDGKSLGRHIAGQLSYFYRRPDAIARDFLSRMDAFEAIADMAIKAPTTPKFQQSHCGEILGALYLEEAFNLRRLYSKLTLLTSEDTNAHKMDAVFVDLSSAEPAFVWVEAKTSVLPTAKSKFSGHRHGILKQMISSLGRYSIEDLRFDLTAARDNLESGTFTEEEQRVITQALRPPGPASLVYVGIATMNASTFDPKDDDYILSEPCAVEFSYRAILVEDLAALASDAFGLFKSLSDVVKER